MMSASVELSPVEMMEIELRKEFGLVDRSFWPAGPWDGEPDFCSWRDASTGYSCAIRRNYMGAWCGYVGIGPEHQSHGHEYESLEDIDAHGALTFSGELDISNDDLWFFGFDCCHYRDMCPRKTKEFAAASYSSVLSLISMPFSLWDGHDKEYRDIAYVTDQVRQLARQLEQLNITVSDHGHATKELHEKTNL